jgi:hypothetical protein
MRGQKGALYMLAVLVGVVVVAILLRQSRPIISGFEAAMQQASVVNPPAIPPQMNYVPDKNTDYLCRSPNGSGVPCPEGTFCDGTQQTCVRKTIFDMPGDLLGYFS